MGTNAHHHVGIRTRDLERAARFYIEAFDGHWESAPFVMEGEMAEMIFGPHPGLRFKICFIGFQNGEIELFEFLEPVEPTAELPQTQTGLMHFALQVDDVAATAAKAEAAGGKMMFPVTDWGTAKVTYVRDPDGNVVEIIDSDMPSTIRLTLESFPEADPANAPS